MTSRYAAPNRQKDSNTVEIRRSRDAAAGSLHTILCTVYLSFTGVISPSMNQWNYKLIMHSQAWIIAHIMKKCMRAFFFNTETMFCLFNF